MSSFVWRPRVPSDVLGSLSNALREVLHAREDLDGHVAHHTYDDRTSAAERRLIAAEQTLIDVSKRVGAL